MGRERYFKGKYYISIDIISFYFDRDECIEFGARTQGADNLLLHFLGISNAVYNICRAFRISFFLYTQDNPPSGCIRESTDGFPHRFRKTSRSLFDLEVVSFYIIKPLEQFFLCHFRYYFNAKLLNFREQSEIVRLHGLDHRLDECYLRIRQLIFIIQLPVNLLNTHTPVDITPRREVLEWNIRPGIARVVLGNF